MFFKYSANYIKDVKSGKLSIKIQRKISPKIVLFARTRAREILMYLRARVRAHRGFFIAFFTVFKQNSESKFAVNNPHYIL